MIPASALILPGINGDILVFVAPSVFFFASFFLSFAVFTVFA